MSVTRGAIAQINAGTNPPEPLLQVSSITNVGGRNKLTLTDGVGTIAAMYVWLIGVLLLTENVKANSLSLSSVCGCFVCKRQASLRYFVDF
jgi:hypothetical protein